MFQGRRVGLQNRLRQVRFLRPMLNVARNMFTVYAIILGRDGIQAWAKTRLDRLDATYPLSR